MTPAFAAGESRQVSQSYKSAVKRTLAAESSRPPRIVGRQPTASAWGDLLRASVDFTDARNFGQQDCVGRGVICAAEIPAELTQDTLTWCNWLHCWRSRNTVILWGPNPPLAGQRNVVWLRQFGRGGGVRL